MTDNPLKQRRKAQVILDTAEEIFTRYRPLKYWALIILKQSH